MSYLQDITARFPVRKRDEEKEAFDNRCKELDLTMS